MGKVFLKLFLLSLPILILISVFIIFDPFKIIYNYRDYSNQTVSLNPDVISAKMYIKNRNKYNYDSFILGSSRTLAFKTKSWKKYLPASASPFVFFANDETLFGIYTKLKYLDKTGANINNCLLLVCTDVTFSLKDSKAHLYIKYPEVAGTSWLNFYEVCIKDYLNFLFLKNYIQYLITKHWVPSMLHYMEERKIKMDTVTNDLSILDEEYDIQHDPADYYKKRTDIFYKRDSIIPPLGPLISNEEMEKLIEIKSIFTKHHTNYRIVITPAYDQKEFNKKDILILQNIFGKDPVFNFAGKNKFTAKKENYYEIMHFRPCVGDSILSIIYNKK